MIHLSGLRVHDPETGSGEIEIRYTGLRPGEKLYEELLIANDPHRTDHPRILKAHEGKLESVVLVTWLKALSSAFVNGDRAEVLKLLQKCVDGYAPGGRSNVAADVVRGVGAGRSSAAMSHSANSPHVAISAGSAIPIAR
jgi:FlaA1/EpsC-like NDP-sugar epimerase